MNRNGVIELAHRPQVAHTEATAEFSRQARREIFEHGLFVARVVGESMNRRIPNGAWCLFRLAPKGPRAGKVALAQHRDISDPDTGGHFTVKLYESTKVTGADGQPIDHLVAKVVCIAHHAA